MFGAALVEGRGGEPLVLKASLDLTLAHEWATGAAMAARLRERGDPASNYLETGATGDVTWSLQAVLPGRVPSVFTVGYAEQLVALACRHAIDSGESSSPAICTTPPLCRVHPPQAGVDRIGLGQPVRRHTATTPTICR